MKSVFRSTLEMKKAIKKVAKEYGRSKNVHELSAEIGVPKSTVLSWVGKMRDSGINIPRTRPRGIVVEAIKELMREQPELIATKGRS